MEKENLAAAVLMTMLGELAAATGAVVMLTHHVNKGAPPEDLRGARDSIRGAGALVNNGRWALALWEASEDRAKEVLKAIGDNRRPDQAGLVYSGGLAKGNAPAGKLLRTLVRNPVNGLLEDVTTAVRASTPRQAEIDDMVFAVLHKARMEDATFGFATSANSLEKVRGEPLRAAKLKIPRGLLPDIFGRLKDRGLIVSTRQKRAGSVIYEPNVHGAEGVALSGGA